MEIRVGVSLPVDNIHQVVEIPFLFLGTILPKKILGNNVSAVKYRLIHCVYIGRKLRLVSTKARGSVKHSGRYVPTCIKRDLVRLRVIEELVAITCPKNMQSEEET